MEPNERVLDKLRKLMLHKQSAEDIGNAEEAAAFSQKISALLLKYKIEMHEVDLSARSDVDGLQVDAPEGVDQELNRVAWQEEIAWGVASTNFCRVLLIDRSNSFIFIGKREDREIAAGLYTYMVKLCVHLSNKAAEEHRESGDADKRFRFMRGLDHRFQLRRGDMRHELDEFKASFRRSFAISVASRMKQQHAAMIREEELRARAGGVQCTALAVQRKSNQELDDFMAKINRPRAPVDEADLARRLSSAGSIAGMRFGGQVALTHKTLKK